MSNSPLQRRFLPSHAILRSFECAARLESFTKAAEELHLTQSAVSRQVKELEQIIGVDLFRRVGRQVVLSEAGANLSNDIATDLKNIRQSVLRAISAGERGRSMRIATLPTFANRWLIPRLADFSLLHPEITINLATRLEPFDMTKERFDLAIHFGLDDWPNTKMVRVFKDEMIAVFSKDFQRKYNILKAEQLKNVPLLHLETRPTAWRDWFKNSDKSEKSAYHGQQFDQFSMLIAGALASIGAALLPKYLIEKELDSGSLVQLGKTSLKTNKSYFVVTPSGGSKPHIEAFSNWIKSAARGK